MLFSFFKLFLIGCIGLISLCSVPIAGKFGVCVVALEAVGLPLIVHCVSRWLADSGPSADFIASMPTDPLAAQDTGTVFMSILEQCSDSLGDQTTCKPNTKGI